MKTTFPLHPGTVPWLSALAGLCLLCVLATCWVNRHRDFIGSPDQAAYAEQADALLAGRGLSIGYVQHFYRRYADIQHPEDHYSPGNGVALALAFRLFGRSEFTATFLSILCACVLLPLLSFLLARQLSASPPFAFACAVSVMFAGIVRQHAYFALADLPLTVCVVTAIILALRQGKWAALGTGVVLAIGYYFKPAALFALPAVSLIFLMVGNRSRKETVTKLLLCWGICLIGISSWLARNWLLFHDPLYSANKYISAGIDFDRNFWTSQFPKVWWADAEQTPPVLTDVFRRYGVGRVVATFGLRFVRTLASQYVCGILLGLLIYGLVRWRRKGQSTSGAIAEDATDQFAGAGRRMLAVAAACGLFVLILILTFSVFPRYLMPVLPPALAIAWAGGEFLLRRVLPSSVEKRGFIAALGRLFPLSRVTAVMFLALFFSIAVSLFELVLQLHGVPPMQLNGDSSKRPGLWASRHLPPDAHIMCQDAWQFRYYAQRDVVNTPCDTPERIAAVMDAYQIRYIIVWGSPAYAETMRRLTPYLAKYADEWQHIRPSGERFDLYVRK